VRLHGVRVIDENGQTAESVDIRKPVGIEMDFEVMQAGHVLTPAYHIINEEGLAVFSTHDQDPGQRGRPRMPGRHLSTAWIPGNFLAEGTLIVAAEMRRHFYEPDVVAFHVMDTMDGDSARGDTGGTIPGVVRPLLQWTNKIPNPSQMALP
jgi:lipopolysaccharide transport system ATP-binding protein